MTTTHPTSETIDGSASEFSDWLAREMPPGTVISDPRWWAPRIAARFATPGQPKPAGAVPMPEIPNAETIREVLRQRRFLCNRESAAAKFDAALTKYPAEDVARLAFEDALHVATGQFKEHFRNRYAANGLPPIPTPEPMIDAREAAGRAVAVPEGFALVPRELTEDMSLEAQVQVAGVDDEMLSEIWEAFLRTAAPIPQQPAAEGAGREAVVNSALFDAIRGAVEESSPRWGEAHDNSALHKLYRREREWIASRVFAAVAHLAPTPAADAGGVTDEIVDRFCGAYFAGWPFMKDRIKDHFREATKIALLAALTPEVRHGA